MKVWWCLEHETSGHPPRCWKQLMTHAYGDCRQVEMQLVPADAETDFSLSNSSVVAPGQRLSEHLSQPERSSTEGRQLVPADARMVSGVTDEELIEELARRGRGQLFQTPFGFRFVWVDYDKGVSRFTSTETVPSLEQPKDPWDYDP